MDGKVDPKVDVPKTEPKVDVAEPKPEKEVVGGGKAGADMNLVRRLADSLSALIDSVGEMKAEIKGLSARLETVEKAIEVNGFPPKKEEIEGKTPEKIRSEAGKVEGEEAKITVVKGNEPKVTVEPRKSAPIPSRASMPKYDRTEEVIRNLLKGKVDSREILSVLERW